ncbi:MAG TPA: hypothetical protein VFD88_06565 [Clostridia bacterium]|nr:hypothetical protein [Clostridia bacterium]
MTRLTAAAKAVPTLEELKLYNVHVTEVEVQPMGEFGTSIKVVYQVDDEELATSGEAQLWGLHQFQ